MARDGERREERAQFLLNKEVSRTKQLMSLRLGGPARGFVLITSRRESERGEVHGGEEKAPSPSPLLSSLSLFPFFQSPVSLSLPLPLLFFIEEQCAPLKSNSRRKGRTVEKGRGEENRARDNLKLSHGPTHDGVRATLFAGGLGTRLRMRFHPGFPCRPFNGTFLARVCFKLANYLSWDTACTRRTAI